MTSVDYNAAFEQAGRILAANDYGHYTVPTKGLYPFQWNWDSCLTALGQSRYDEARGWRGAHHKLDAGREWGIALADVPAITPESTALARALKRHGFRFVGPTTAYALMQACVLVDDHLTGCWARSVGSTAP